jgi:hypothetical protein
MKSFNIYSSPENHSHEFFDDMHQAMRHLYGRPVLSQIQADSTREGVAAFIERCAPAEFFDFLDLSFKIDIAWRIFGSSRENEFVDALNEIFRMEDAPYQLTPGVTREEDNPVREGRFSGGRRIIRVAFPRVVRVDDEVAHTEAILPALSVLTDPDYSGANDEVRKALEDYRKGDFEDCLVKCGSAFESVLKVLCRKNGLPLDETKDTAGPLLDRVLPHSWLDTGTFKEPLIAIARLRNRLSAAHGGGSKVRTVPRHVAQYSLTSTAAAKLAGTIKISRERLLRLESQVQFPRPRWPSEPTRKEQLELDECCIS